MRPMMIVPLLAACAVAGCNNSDTVTAKNESVEAVAGKVAASDNKPLPGRWETSVKFGNSVAGGAQASVGGAPLATCVTPEMAARSDGSQFRQTSQDCQYDTFTMAGGKVDGVMTCKHDSMTQRVTLSGTYGPQAYDMKMISRMEIQPGKAMTTEMMVSSRRVGECNGTEIKADATAAPAAR